MEEKSSEGSAQLTLTGPGKRDRRGKGAKQKQSDAFRAKQNAAAQAEIQAGILKRLKISDPTDLADVVPKPIVEPETVPITFTGIPRFISQLWSEMKALGASNFARLATDENYCIFLKCCMCLMDVKLCYAQRVCSGTCLPLESRNWFTLDELTNFRQRFTTLPVALAIFVESVGVFNYQNQAIVPTASLVTPPSASGAMNYSLRLVSNLVQELRTPVRQDAVLYRIALGLNQLPKIVWEQSEVPVPAPADGVQPPPAICFNLSPESVAFWSNRPTNAELAIFQNLVFAYGTKPGRNVCCDLASGLGSPVQLVRFPEEVDLDETTTLFYTNATVPSFELSLAPALLLGADYLYDNAGKSWFVSSYDHCYQKGQANQTAAVTAVLWASKQ